MKLKAAFTLLMTLIIFFWAIFPAHAEHPSDKVTSIEVKYVLNSYHLAGYQVSKPLRVEATGYDACKKCCGKTDGITATGTLAQVGRTVAVDPNVIQLGTKIYIPELNTIFTAEDVGGKILGNRIDIFMKTHQQALNFGRKKLTIYLLELPIQI